MVENPALVDNQAPLGPTGIDGNLAIANSAEQATDDKPPEQAVIEEIGDNALEGSDVVEPPAFTQQAPVHIEVSSDEKGSDHEKVRTFSFIHKDEEGNSYIKKDPEAPEDNKENRRYITEEEEENPKESLFRTDENGRQYVIKEPEKEREGLHEIGNRRYLTEEESRELTEEAPQIVDETPVQEHEVDNSDKQEEKLKPIDTSSIEDIVNVDNRGRGHKEGTNHSNGQFISDENMALIEANQDLIRNNMPPDEPEHQGPKLKAVDVATPIPDPGKEDGEPGTPDGNGPEGPGGNGPEGPEIPPIPEVLNQDWPEVIAIQQAQEALVAASERMGHAKYRLERFLAGHDARELYDTAGEDMRGAHEVYIQANAALYAREDQRIGDLREFNHQELTDLETRLTELSAEKAEAGENYDGHLDDEIQRLSESAAYHHEYDALIDQVLEQRTTERAAAQIQDIANINVMVDQALVRQREAAHPRLHRINEWINRRLHFERPRNRMIAGAAFTAMGIVGGLTLNPVLVGAAAAGSSALRGYGSYQFARGVGERVANRRLNMDEIQTIDDYVEASRRQSDARRTSKRVGSAVAAALIVAPIVGKMLAAAPQHSGLPASHTAPNPTPQHISPKPPHTVGPPPITPVDGNMVPWDYGMNVLHTNISNPETLSRLVHNSLGISFQGNGLGNGMGKILSVTYGGQTFTDLAHINGAIQAVLG